MRRQRNLSQMKEQNKTPEKRLKVEISHLSDAQFKTLIIRMLQELIGYFNSIEKQTNKTPKTKNNKKNPKQK